MSNTKDNNTIRLAAGPLPFAALRQERVIGAGQTLADIIDQAGIPQTLQSGMTAAINGARIPRRHWGKVRPKPGTTLSLRYAPMGGGGGKNPLRTVLSLALIAAAPQLSGTLLGALNIPAGASVLGISAGRLLAGGLSLIGRMALGSIAPPGAPKFQSQRESATLFIQGARNALTPFARVPRVLGTHRMVPPMAARPFTESIGQDQYIRMLFVWGYGPLRIEDLKIGETPLAEFDDVEIQTVTGADDDAPLTLYGATVLQNDLQITLTNASGYQTRTTEAEADEISVDITLPRGLVGFDPNGKKLVREIALEIQYSPAGLGLWSAGAASYSTIAATTKSIPVKPAAYIINDTTVAVTRIDRVVMDPASGQISVINGAPFRSGVDRGAALPPAVPAGQLLLARIERRSDDPDVIPSGKITDERAASLFGSAFQASGDFLVSSHTDANKINIAAGGLKHSGITISARQTAALRKSVSFKVNRGQYDVRVRRLTADQTSDSIMDETVWTALRTHRNENPVRMPGLAMTALRIKATDQLNGVIDRFNGVVSSILPDWTGSDWTPQVTSNPASLFRHILQGVCNARPLADSRIDLERLQGWHDACRVNAREFNAVIDYDTSVRRILADVAAAGRASPAIIDGKWAIIEDKAQGLPVQHFTPRNTFGFRGEKAFDDLPHALRIRFLNRDKGWLEDERLVFDDGYAQDNATKFEGIELPGVTDPGQIWKDGRYHIATARLRPEVFSFMTDIEHIVCTRGDLIRFTHDVPLFGLGAARVASVASSGSDVVSVTLDAQLTMEAGKSYALRFRAGDGSSSVHAVTTVAGTSDTLSFAAPFPLSQAPQPGDLALYGESGTESVELIIRSIEPQGNLGARLTCVAAASAVHQAESGDLPAFDSMITLPPELTRPPAPVIAQIQSGAEVSQRAADGSVSSRIVITLAPPGFSSPLGVKVRIRASGESGFHPASSLMETPQRIAISGIEEGQAYDILLFYTTSSDILSQPVQITSHVVEGSSEPPPDVAALYLAARGNTVHLSWPSVNDADLDHYRLRFSPVTTGASWASAVDAIERISAHATSITAPAAAGIFLIKAVDAAGRESANAVSAVSSVSAIAEFHTVGFLDGSPGFLGAKTGTIEDGGILRLDSADSIDDWSDTDAVINADIGNSGLLPSGTYNFADIYDFGGIFTMTASALIEVTGMDTNVTMDVLEDTDNVENWDGGVDASRWTAQLQIRTTPDDPLASPVWSDWTPFVIGDYTARAFDLRVVMQSLSSGITPAVSSLSARIDMAYRSAGTSAVAATGAGLTVSYAQPFYDTPVISIAARNMQSGDYYALTDVNATDFTIRFYDSTDTGIARDFDYTATGYGRQL